MPWRFLDARERTINFNLVDQLPNPPVLNVGCGDARRNYTSNATKEMISLLDQKFVCPDGTS